MARTLSGQADKRALTIYFICVPYLISFLLSLSSHLVLRQTSTSFLMRRQSSKTQLNENAALHWIIPAVHCWGMRCMALGASETKYLQCFCDTAILCHQTIWNTWKPRFVCELPFTNFYIVRFWRKCFQLALNLFNPEVYLGYSNISL